MPRLDDTKLSRAARIAAEFNPAQLPSSFYADPYPTYRALQEFEPLHRCADGSLFLTRYEHLDAVYRERTRVSSDKRLAFAPRFGTQSPLYAHHTTSLVFNDPPYHSRVRRHIVGALSPTALRAMSAQVERLVDDLCDAMARAGSVDLIADFAAAIPVEVIGNLLDVPHEERGPLRDWSLAILGALEPVVTPDMAETGNRAVAPPSNTAKRSRVMVASRTGDCFKNRIPSTSPSNPSALRLGTEPLGATGSP